jgi:hypothetical protein
MVRLRLIGNIVVAKADEQFPVKPPPYLEESLSLDDAVEEILRPEIMKETDGRSQNGTPVKFSESWTEFGTALSTTKGKKKKHPSASFWE